MASNALRGGKNIYGPQALQSNWFEQRFEPEHQENTRQSVGMMPTKNAKTFTKMSDAYGSHAKEAMAQKPMVTDTSNFIEMQIDGPERYQTTHKESYSHPDNRQEAFVPGWMKVPEDKLAAYRATWTKSNPDQFERTK
eukprot:gnl/TRDRNA2_/TRDRNA2_178671_c0_seq1.p1 gnl/TRDRNA2_/TRDRNA2_178671_c0~~gnl/TRDRNA2_/TRDRNA2_178671_c0_seq1.p1  ORF type:complete len:156 (+),score=26.65 gnl/TRDRNA2_/TRDRNA2_178671_c0_seq1:57-470(+)